MWATWASMPHVPPDWLIHHPMEVIIGDAKDVMTDLLQDDVAVLPQIDLRRTDETDLHLTFAKMASWVQAGAIRGLLRP